MLDHGNRVLVLGDNFLDLLCRYHCIRSDALALLDMLKERLVSLSFLAAWAGEVEQLENLLHTPVHLDWLLVAPAVLYRARPASLHFDTVLAVEAIAAWAFKWERLHDELAQTADEKVDCGGHS